MSYGFYLLWIAPYLWLGIGAFFFFRRHYERRLPAFGTYLGFKLLEFVALFTISFSAPHFSNTPLHFYRVAALSGLMVSVVLEVAVLYELAKALIFRRSGLAKSLFPLARWAAAILVLGSALVSALLPQRKIERVGALFQTLDLSANLVMIGLLFVLLLFSSALNLSWRSLPAGIALGFGIWSSSELAGSALLSQLGKLGYLTTDVIRMSAFQICTVIWMVYILRPERHTEFTGTGLQLPELELLDEQMQRMIRP